MQRFQPIPQPGQAPPAHPPSPGITFDRERLLRRLQTDLAQADAEIQEVRAQSRRLLEIEATRPLTPDEAAQARAVNQHAQALRLRLQQLRAEFAQLQGSRDRHKRRR